MAHRRIAKELKDLEILCPTHYGFAPINDQYIYQMKGFIIGPADTPYEDGIYEFSIKLNHFYPFQRPKIKMNTKIYHPNINDNGGMKVPILREWSPAMTIAKTCESIIHLLKTPDPNYGVLRPEIAREYKQNRQQFIVTAQKWNNRYAEGKSIDSNEMLCFAPVTVDIMNKRYNMIHKAMVNLFGNTLGEVCEK